MTLVEYSFGAEADDEKLDFVLVKEEDAEDLPATKDLLSRFSR